MGPVRKRETEASKMLFWTMGEISFMPSEHGHPTLINVVAIFQFRVCCQIHLKLKGDYDLVSLGQ